MKYIIIYLSHTYEVYYHLSFTHIYLNVLGSETINIENADFSSWDRNTVVKIEYYDISYYYKEIYVLKLK